jgi:hypothetical protein
MRRRQVRARCSSGIPTKRRRIRVGMIQLPGIVEGRTGILRLLGKRQSRRNDLGTAMSGTVTNPRTFAECCGADTPFKSLSNVSRSRPTTDRARCFLSTRLMLILQKGSARRWPRRTSPHPSVRLGPRLLRLTHRSRAEGGIGSRNGTPLPHKGHRGE